MGQAATADVRTPEDDRLWFVLATGWNKERIARENLMRQDIETYLPMHLREIKPRGQPARTIGVPFFPRYIFARIDPAAANWRAIYGTRGVAGVLPSCAQASAVLAKLIADMQRAEVRGYQQLSPDKPSCPFNEGDIVTYGAFRDAIFKQRVDERRALILVSILGRSDLHVVDIASLE